MSEIIEDESRKNYRKPRQPDWKTAKMAHVGVERLAAGNSERDGSEYDEAGARRGEKDASCVRGVQRFKDARHCGDLQHSDHRDYGEP